MLGVLPAGSYLYLKKGYDFRKQIISDLSKKDPFKTLIVAKDSMKINFKGKCTVIALKENKTNEQIYNQFKDAKGFQMLTIQDQQLDKKYPANSASENKQNHYYELDSTSIDRLLHDYKSDFVLLDSLGNVRRTYLNEKEEMKKLVLHISALLPYYDEKKGR
jgi:hypothetical protein